MKEKVCTSCGYVGEAVNQCFESFMLDALVWLITISLIFMTALVPLIIIPAAWTIYHIVNFKSKCPKCESLDMVSLESHKGKTVIKHSAS
jgi:hypothetical protein